MLTLQANLALGPSLLVCLRMLPASYCLTRPNMLSRPWPLAAAQAEAAPSSSLGMSYVARPALENIHEDGVWSCAWSSNGQIVTGSCDEMVQTYMVHGQTIDKKHALRGHQLGVTSVSVSETGLAASSALDSHIRLWDLESGTERGVIDAGPVEAWTVSLSADGRTVASGSQGGNVNLWSVEGGEKTHTLQTGGKFCMSVAISPDGSKVACGAADGAVSVFDMATQKLLRKLEGHTLTVRTVAFSRDSVRLPPATQPLPPLPRSCRCAAVPPGARVRCTSPSLGPPPIARPPNSCRVASAPPQEKLMTGSDDARANLYDVSSGTQLASFEGHTSWVLGVALSPDDTHAVSCSSDHSVKVWDLAGSSKRCVQTLADVHNDQVWGVAFDPNGGRFCSVGDDMSLRLYEQGGSGSTGA